MTPAVITALWIGGGAAAAYALTQGNDPGPPAEPGPTPVDVLTGLASRIGGVLPGALAAGAGLGGVGGAAGSTLGTAAGTVIGGGIGAASSGVGVGPGAAAGATIGGAAGLVIGGAAGFAVGASAPLVGEVARTDLGVLLTFGFPRRT